MRTVLTVGSLHYDIMVDADHLPRRDETAIGSRWYPKFGGKGGNQAIAVHRAGATSRMVGAVGDDEFGRYLLEKLQAGGVQAGAVRAIPGTGSGISVAITDKAGDYAATIVSGANLLIDPAWLADPAIWADVGLLVLQNEAPEAVNRAAAQAARARGLKTLLNAAPFRPLSPAFAASVDLLVVNAVEAEMMGAGPVQDLPSAARAATHLASTFTSGVVTAGAHGLVAWGGGQPQLALPAERVTVVSTHGAGDAFIGTLAALLAGGAGLHAACGAAAHAAALHVSGG